MLKYGFVFLQLAVVGISLCGAGMTEEEHDAIANILQPIIVDCLKECDLEKGDMENKEGYNCLKKCVLKKLGVLTQDGKFDVDAVKARILATDKNEESAKKHLALLDDCLKGKDLDLKNDKDDEKKVDIIYECFDNVHKSDEA